MAYMVNVMINMDGGHITIAHGGTEMGQGR